MPTTYAFQKKTKCPFNNLSFLPKADGHAGHLLVFDEEKKTLSFLHGRSNHLGVAANVSLADDKLLREAKSWIAKQISEGNLAEVAQPKAAAEPSPKAEQVQQDPKAK